MRKKTVKTKPRSQEDPGLVRAPGGRAQGRTGETAGGPAGAVEAGTRAGAVDAGQLFSFFFLVVSRDDSPTARLSRPYPGIGPTSHAIIGAHAFPLPSCA